VLLPVHGKFSVIEGGVVYYIRADHIGRPVFATNAAGAKVWSAVYTPFGGVHTSTGSLPTNRFPGQWFQTESGLHQNWMRDYDPTTGRYIQADPLGLVDGASVYGYVKSNPSNLFDPSGTQSIGDPNGRVPGGPWKWSPDPGNSRGGGSWTNDRGGTTSWDGPGSHWDTHDHSGAKRDRYDRWGNKLDPNDPHKYERKRKPKVPPLLTPRMPLLIMPFPPCLLSPPDALGRSGCERPVACLENDSEPLVFSSL
jgi:RHS repeat-associated protein